MYRSYLACFEMGRVGLVRIAQVARLHEAVPPRFYGGTERVVSYLTEHLVQLGHDVTLFASGDSETRARLGADLPAVVAP
jgi:Glycosyltransferase Family 4